MASNSIVLAFDLYGTLLNTDSVAAHLATLAGADTGQSLALLWRRYQLEYTWRLNSLGRFDSFDSITRNALLHAARDMQVSLRDEQIRDLMHKYNSLSTFPDVAGALQRIKTSSESASALNITPVIFSNGSRSMVGQSVQQSPSLSPFADLFTDIITVDEVQTFKPVPAVYHHLARRVGKSQTPEQIWLVSGNPFDVNGARNAGWNAAWVDRSGLGWRDALLAEGMPTVSASDLDSLIARITQWCGRDE